MAYVARTPARAGQHSLTGTALHTSLFWKHERALAVPAASSAPLIPDSRIPRSATPNSQCLPNLPTYDFNVSPHLPIPALAMNQARPATVPIRADQARSRSRSSIPIRIPGCGSGTDADADPRLDVRIISASVSAGWPRVGRRRQRHRAHMTHDTSLDIQRRSFDGRREWT